MKIAFTLWITKIMLKLKTLENKMKDKIPEILTLTIISIFMAFIGYSGYGEKYMLIMGGTTAVICILMYLVIIMESINRRKKE